MGKVWNADIENFPSHQRLTRALEDVTDDLALEILGWFADNGEVCFERRSSDGQLVFYTYLTELSEPDEKSGRKLFAVDTTLDEVFRKYLLNQGCDAEPDEYLEAAESLERWAAEFRRRAAQEGEG